MRPAGVPGAEPTRPTLNERYRDLLRRIADAQANGARPARWQRLAEDCRALRREFDAEADLRRKYDAPTAQAYADAAETLRECEGPCRAWAQAERVSERSLAKARGRGRAA